MQSEGRNARFLTCLFPHLSSPKPLSKSGQRGTGGGPEESSGRCQGDGGGGEWVWASVWVCMFWSWLPPQWKGAAMAVTCVRWGSEPVCTEHGPQAGAGSGGFSGSIMRRAIFWCDLSETFRVSLHWIGEVQRQGCGLPFEKKKKIDYIRGKWRATYAHWGFNAVCCLILGEIVVCIVKLEFKNLLTFLLLQGGRSTKLCPNTPWQL